MLEDKLEGASSDDAGVSVGVQARTALAPGGELRERSHG